MIKLATLFSGVGAIEEALLKMHIPHEIVFACDNGEREIDIDIEAIKNETKSMSVAQKNDYIARIYEEKSKKENLMQKQYCANFDVREGHFYQDVRLLDGTVYQDEKIDLLVGGSPCQSFSVIGKRGGLEDTRGTLFYDYARIVKECQPKVFIYENVLGMLTHDKGRTWATIDNVFQSLGYDIKVHKLDAKNYGIPQERKRLFVVGTQNENTISTPQTVNLDTVLENYLEDAVPAKYYLGKKGFEFVTNPIYFNRAKVNGTIMMCQKANQQFNWNGDFRFEPLNHNRHTPEILERAYVGEYNGEIGVTRQLTPRECFRLMGFNDDYKIVVNDTTAWRQAGNSIVVNVLEAIIAELSRARLLQC
ncbi:MAG: DNA (cytosine-5-)-methyltransferase [Clostridiales bacterium]|nr:DNA (cytosine-5-)-methyltransferase [Clostridiales bacterium]